MNIAINGFGRIGRAFFRLAIKEPDVQIVAINDLANLENLAYLLKNDSVYGKFNTEIKGLNNKLVVGGKEILFFHEKIQKIFHGKI